MTEAERDMEERDAQVAALQARLDYVTALSNWADQMPQPPATTTAAERSFGEILGEINTRLRKIIECGYLQGVLNDATDGLIAHPGDLFLERIKEQTEKRMRDEGCSSL
jgi:hypothetical protein